MQRNVALGIQNFSKLRENNYFYIDKTRFIKEWWERGDDITLITRPRRFGKTLMLDMVKTFFSPEYSGRCDLFEGLSIWNEKKYRELQGTTPVIFLSFANIKELSFSAVKYNICSILTRLYSQYSFIVSSQVLSKNEIRQFNSVSRDMSLEKAKESLSCLAEYITRYYNKKPIILIDEYDTPMQEAWIHGYWDDVANFFRGFFNSTFKTNPWIDRGLMTGITRISKDSLFSDMNNLEVVTVTSPFYADCFGFTEKEVFLSLEEYGLFDKDGVKAWYDGFTFGCNKDIYNPWSILQYIRKKEFDTYWVDTSSNLLVGSLIQQSKKELKIQIETLLQGKSIVTHLDEQIVFNQLKIVPSAVISLLIATGYLNVISCDKSIKQYEIEITNHEVKLMLESLIKQWFNSEILSSISQEFRNALYECRIERLNTMMNKITMETFSFFDMSGKEPEKFYHGFTLGLIVDLKGRYQIESNRESGYGRYDVMLFPLHSQDPGIVIEFKSLAADEGEKDLSDTLASALNQIADRNYVAALEARGIPHDRIYAYGFAFRGKDVLIGGGRL